MGSVPQPRQQFAAVDPFACQVPIVGNELSQQAMPRCCFGGDVPGAGPVAVIGAIPDQIGERGARGDGGDQVGDVHRRRCG